MKVGFYDSGLGGLTIFKEALKSIKVDYMYLGDNKNAPYGVKEKEEVKKYIYDNVDFLIKNGCEVIVVACNTATSIAINDLRNKYSNICIIGTEPAVKKATDSDNSKRILVCATSITIREGKLKDLITKLKANDIVDMISLDKLVEFAESEKVDLLSKENNDVVENYLKEKLSEYKFSDYSHVVLGCTHFPLFKKEFQNIFGENVSIIDGSTGVVRNLKNKINILNIENENVNLENSISNIQLVITKENKKFVEKFKQITGIKDFDVIIK